MRAAFDIDMARPGILEPLDSIGRKDEVEIEGAVLQLDEVLPAEDLGGLVTSQGEAELAERGHDALAVLRRSLDKQIRVLGRAREAEQDAPTCR